MVVETSVGISVLLNALALELLGWTAGGIVIPGYLALYLDQPGRIALTFAVSLVTLMIVKLMARRMIIYGRRQFSAMLLVGFTVNLLLAQFTSQILSAASIGGASFDLRIIGYLAPGLIANEMANQGIVVTISLTLLITIIIGFVLQLIFGTGVGF